jgi:single-strand DNA-binding protein
VSTVSFDIAVNRRTAKEGEQQADYIRCVAWKNTAEFISRYFTKGSSICVTGSITTRTWNDKDGNKKHATEVVVRDARFVDSKTDAQPETPKFEEIAPDEDLPF